MAHQAALGVCTMKSKFEELADSKRELRRLVLEHAQIIAATPCRADMTRAYQQVLEDLEMDIVSALDRHERNWDKI